MREKNWKVLCALLAFGFASDVIFSSILISKLSKENEYHLKLASLLLDILEKREIELDEFETLALSYFFD